jgi:hypothetical protein
VGVVPFERKRALRKGSSAKIWDPIELSASQWRAMLISQSTTKGKVKGFGLEARSSLSGLGDWARVSGRDETHL